MNSATKRNRRFLFVLLAVSASSLSVARAADISSNQTEPAQTAASRPWAVIVSPYVWTAAMKGNASLGGHDTTVDVPFKDTLHHLNFALMGAIEVTTGRWGVYFNGETVKTSQDEVVRTLQLGFSSTMSMIAGGAYYRIYESRLGGNTVFGAPRTFAIEPTAGVRWTRLSARLSTGPISVEKSVDWTDPFVGVRLSADVNERWNIFAEADIGGFRSGSQMSVNAQVYAGYRTMILDRPTILRAGYRVLHQNYETADFTGHMFRWDVTQHGPVVGFSMYF